MSGHFVGKVVQTVTGDLRVERYLQTVLQSPTSPTLSINELEGVIVSLTNAGYRQDSAVFFQNAPQKQVAPVSAEEEVTTIHAAKRTRDTSHSPITKTDLFTEATEFMTPISEVVKKKDEHGIENRRHHKSARHERTYVFKLSFDETSTQSPPRLAGSQ